MSVVELAVKKVKGLSAPQARQLLAWLAAHPPQAPTTRRKRRPQTMRQLKAWHDSVRGTTDWEIPRMPSERIRPPVSFE